MDTLVKEKLNLKCSNVDWCGNIPKDWRVEKIKAHFKLSKERASADGNDILSLTQKGIKVRDISGNEGQMAASYDNYAKLRKGDIVLNPMDLISGYVDLASQEGIISPAYTILRNKKTELNLEYAKHYFQWHYIFNIFFPFGKGVSIDHRWTLADDVLLNFPILIPPIKTQEKIADFLDEKTKNIDWLINKKQKLIEILFEKRVATIARVVTKGISPNVKMKNSGIEWIGNIPEKWEIRKISQVFPLIGSGTTPSSENASYYEGDNYWIQSGDINGGILNTTKKKISDQALRDYSTLKLYDIDSIVMAMYGASVGNICMTNIEATTNQACCVLSKSKILDSKYSFYYLLASKGVLISMGQGGSQPNINKETIKNHKIIIPSKKEQLEIVQYLDLQMKKIDEVINKTRNQIKKLTEYRASLICNAVTGKIKI